ncbi:MAG: fasciclin domain-containing protein [Candidatus Sericytochromatia bacterium]
MKSISLLGGCLALSVLLSSCDSIQTYLADITGSRQETVKTESTTPIYPANNVDRPRNKPAIPSVSIVNKKTVKTAENSPPASMALKSTKNPPIAAAEAKGIEKRPERTLVNLLLTEQNLSTLYQLMVQADMIGLLDSGKYTLLAPNNQAFSQVPKARMEALRQNHDKLRLVLMNHLIQKPLSSGELVRMKSVQTLQGGKKLSVSEGPDAKPMIQQAHVIHPNMWASNGLVHIIDQPLIPAGL